MNAFLKLVSSIHHDVLPYHGLSILMILAMNGILQAYVINAVSINHFTAVPVPVLLDDVL